MTDYYEQELRPTGKANEYQIFYIKKTLSPEVEAEILAIKEVKDDKLEL